MSDNNLNFLCCSITFCPTSLHLHRDSDSLDLYLPLLDPLSFSPDLQILFFSLPSPGSCPLFPVFQLSRFFCSIPMPA